MAEQFLTLMAELDDESQDRFNSLYEELKMFGFVGTQTPNLRYHISLASYPVDKEQEAIEHVKKVAAKNKAVDVSISHLGIFPGGKVLFGAPDKSAKLEKLHEACLTKYSISQYAWTPHATIIIDEPNRIGEAVPIVSKSFIPFPGKIVRLHLCAFWPTRDIISIDLTNE